MTTKTEITILISGPKASGKTLLGNYLAAVLKEAGFTVEHDGLPVHNLHGATVAKRVLTQLHVPSRAEVKIETTNLDVGPLEIRVPPGVDWSKALKNAAGSIEEVQEPTPFQRFARGEKLTDKDLIAAMDATIEKLEAFKAEQKSAKTKTQASPSGTVRDAAEPYPPEPKKDPRPNWVQKLDAAIAAAEPGGPLVGLLGFSTYRGVRMVAEVVRNMPASIEVKLYDWRQEGGSGGLRVRLDLEAGCILGRVNRDNFKPLPFRDQNDRLKPILKEIYLPKKGK